jgi:hypothetical protein
MLPGVMKPPNPERNQTLVFDLSAFAAESLAAILGIDGPPGELLTAEGPLTGADPDGAVWHLATCHRCGDLAQPFINADGRDAWAVSHATTTGHTVILSADPNPAGFAPVVLRIGADMWAWTCIGCLAAGRPFGTGADGSGHPTGQLALAAFRAHARDHRA